MKKIPLGHRPTVIQCIIVLYLFYSSVQGSDIPVIFVVILVLSIDPLDKSMRGFIVGRDGLSDLVDKRYCGQGHEYDGWMLRTEKLMRSSI